LKSFVKLLELAKTLVSIRTFLYLLRSAPFNQRETIQSEMLTRRDRTIQNCNPSAVDRCVEIRISMLLSVFTAASLGPDRA
jgi:hypothetical protein